MDERQRRAWRALELGVEWTLRDGVVADRPLPAAAAAAREADPEPVETAPVRSADGAAPASNAAAPTIPLRPVAARTLDWDALQQAVAGCPACGLCRTRKRAVFGSGAPGASWMLVGEAPGADEDATGEPFVGQAGKLLDQMLASIGIDRASEAFVSNVLKCRPPGNRDPLPEEVATCEPYLVRQIELVRPRLIVVLGRFAAQSLLRTDATVASLRGKVHRYRVDAIDVPLIVTYHPAYLLRSPNDKARAWADLCLARAVYENGSG